VDRELYYEERVLEKEVADGPEAATTEQQQRISVHEARPVGSEDIAKGRHYSLVVARWKCTSVDNSDFLTVRQVHALSSSIQSTHVHKLFHSRLTPTPTCAPTKQWSKRGTSALHMCDPSSPIRFSYTSNCRDTCPSSKWTLCAYMFHQMLSRYPMQRFDFLRSISTCT
jgi:hypothetical protein